MLETEAATTNFDIERIASETCVVSSACTRVKSNISRAAVAVWFAHLRFSSIATSVLVPAERISATRWPISTAVPVTCSANSASLPQPVQATPGLTARAAVERQQIAAISNYRRELLGVSTMSPSQMNDPEDR